MSIESFQDALPPLQGTQPSTAVARSRDKPMMCSDKLRGIDCTSLNPHNGTPRQTRILLNRRKSKGHPCPQQLSCGPPTWALCPSGHLGSGGSLTAGLLSSPQAPPVEYLVTATAGRGPHDTAWRHKSGATVAPLFAVNLEAHQLGVPTATIKNGGGAGSSLLARVGMAFWAKGVWTGIKKDNKIKLMQHRTSGSHSGGRWHKLMLGVGTVHKGEARPITSVCGLLASWALPLSTGPVWSSFPPAGC